MQNDPSAVTSLQKILNSDPLYRAGRAFLTSFLATFVIFLNGVASAPETGLQKAAVTAAVVAALAAGLRAAIDTLTHTLGGKTTTYPEEWNESGEGKNE